MIRSKFNSGDKYGKVILTGSSYMHNGRRLVEYVCECGTTKFSPLTNLKRGITKSCGCLKLTNMGSVTHGMSRKHPLYFVWKNMKQRCYGTAASRHFLLYGARGVTVCDEWRNDYKAFFEWATSNGWEKGRELDKDKLSPSGVGMEYSPKYCSFISHQDNMLYTQRGTQIEYNGEKKPLKKWCIELGLDFHDTYRRVKQFNWTIDRAFSAKTSSGGAVR